METTIKKTVKGATMEAIFNNSELVNIRLFEALNLEKEKDYNPEYNYIYEIKIRHAEKDDANVLFEEARFKYEIEQCKKKLINYNKEKIIDAITGLLYNKGDKQIAGHHNS